MAQDEKMLVPVEPTEAQIEAFRDWYFKHTGNGLVTRNAAKAVQTVLSAAPAQPAAVEGAGEPVAWQIEDREEGWIDFNPTNDAQKNPATWAKLGWNVRPLYAHPSPTPAADDGRSDPDDPTEEMIQAALEVDFDNEDERGAVINLWHVMKAAAPPAADDALRVAEEALEPFVRHGRACGALSDEAGTFWIMTDAGHRDVPAKDFRRAAEALAALKAEKK